MVRFRMMPAVQAGQKRNVSVRNAGHCPATLCWLQDCHTDPDSRNQCNRIKPGSEIQLNTYLDHCFRAWGCPDADSPTAEEPQDFSVDTETKVLLIAGRAKGMSDPDQEVQGGGVGRQVSVSAQEWLTDAYEAMSDYSKFKKAATRHRYRIVVTAGLGLAVIVAAFSIGGSKSDSTAGVLSLVRSVLLVPDCDPKTLFSARPPSLHQLLKTYAVLAMLADHYAKVFGPLKDTVLLTLPAQAGGALLFYFLVGANSNRASYTSGVVRMLLLQVFLESVCNMPVMTFDTLFTLSLIRLVVVSLTDRAVDGPVSNPTVSVPSWADENLVIAHAIAMGALFLLHIPFGPDGCRMLAYPASFFYGAAGALLAAFNRLIGEQSEKDQQDAYGVRRLAWFWLAVGTLISVRCCPFYFIFPAFIGSHSSFSQLQSRFTPKPSLRIFHCPRRHCLG